MKNELSLTDIIIRPPRPDDSIEELTDLLHRAYDRLGRMGLRYFATFQTPEQTRERLAKGDPLVAELNGRLIGTATLYTNARKDDPDLYRRDDVGWFGQFGVEPELQGMGIGGLLLAAIEEKARERGLAELALDTAETATHLIDWYERRGWRIVGEVRWEGANYRSVLMSKRIGVSSKFSMHNSK